MKAGAKGRLAALNSRRLVPEIVFDIARMIESGGSMFGWGSVEQEETTENKPDMDGREDEFNDEDFHGNL